MKKCIALCLLLLMAVPALADTHFVCNNISTCNAGGGSGWSGTPSNSGTCGSKTNPCSTIAYGVSQLSSGDTLIVGNGTYTDINPIRDPVSGTVGAYTTIQAEVDFGVYINGASWGTSSWGYGIRIDNRSYVKVQGFRINAAQNSTGGPITMTAGTNHVKIIKCGFWNGPVGDNGEIAGTGPNTSYILFEDCYAFGGSRAGFTAYQSDHVIFRRCVARPDYYHFDLQTSGFCNYDSMATIFQNCIVANMAGGSATNPSLQVYAPFFFENKSDIQPHTSIEMHGNIVLNNSTYYGAVYDQVPADTRVMYDNILWGNSGGFQSSDYINGETYYPATYDIKRMTSGVNNLAYDHWNNAFDHTAVYGGGDGLGGAGTGISIMLNLTSAVINSIFYGNASYGVADYVTGSYNSIYGNGAATGGLHSPTLTNSNTSHNPIYNASTNPTGSIKWLPKGPETGSVLATAGSGGGSVGAQIMWKIGVDGTLHGDTGYNTVRSPANGYGGTSDRLWPFPNEAQIKSDFASYSGSGLAGARGFATGTSMDGSAQSLTKYIWEYLGNQAPADYYSDAPAPDTTPNPFTFTDVTGATRSTQYTSNTITVAGIDSTAAVSITGGTYSKNGGAYISTAGTAAIGDTFTVRATSSASYSTAVNVVLTIGGVSDTYTVTTEADPTALPGIHVGRGQAGDPTTLAGVSWSSLVAGDTVYIHPGTYHEKICVGSVGTAANPIRVIGVLDGSGNRPVIDGQSATTPSSCDFAGPSIQVRGLVLLQGNTVSNVAPKYVEIKNLEIKNAYESYTFTNEAGATQTYDSLASGVLIRSAQNITVENCVISNCAMAVFSMTGENDTGTNDIYDGLVKDTILRGNYFYGNGRANDYYTHQTYIQGLRATYEYNRYGAMRAISQGSHLKDRSVGTVIRYNLIDGLTPAGWYLDLVEPEDTQTLLTNNLYRQTHVYGNTLINDTSNDPIFIHWNEDHGNQNGRARVTGGKLLFYDNTIINKRNATDVATITIFNTHEGGWSCPSSEQGHIDVRNNIIASIPRTTGAASAIQMSYCSTSYIDYGPNWITSGYSQGTTHVTGTGSIISTNPINFTSTTAPYNPRLTAGSTAIGTAGALASEVTSNYLGLNLTPAYQYAGPTTHQAVEARSAVTDLGAYGYSSAPVQTRRATGGGTIAGSLN